MHDYKPQAQKTRSEKLLQSFAQTRLGGRLFITVFPAIDGKRRQMRAPIAAEGEERERLWQMVCDNYTGYATYQRRARGRVIPVIALQPR